MRKKIHMDRTFARAGRALNVPGTLDSRAVLTLSLGRATTASGEVRRDVRAVEVVAGKASDAARSETLGAAGDVTVGEGAPATVVTVAVAVVESTRRGKGGGGGRRRGRSGRRGDTVAVVVAPLAAAAVAGVRAIWLLVVVLRGHAGSDAVVPVPLTRALVTAGRDAMVVAVATAGHAAALAREPSEEISTVGRPQNKRTHQNSCEAQLLALPLP